MRAGVGLLALALLLAPPLARSAWPPACDGCICASNSTNGCAAVWFSFRQDGTAAIKDVGLAFTYSQPARSDPGYRWFISNRDTWLGNTTFIDGAGSIFFVPFLPYRPAALADSPPQGPSPTWLISSVAPLGDFALYPGEWACTDDALLQRSLNGGLGPTQPACQYDRDQPPLPVNTPVCPVREHAQIDCSCLRTPQPSRLFDGYYIGSGWVLAQAALNLANGSTVEYPGPSVRSIPTGLGLGVVPASNPLQEGELRPIVAFATADNAVNVSFFVSLFNPCKACPLSCPLCKSPALWASPGCCPSGQRMVSGVCCAASALATSPPACCPSVPPGPWVTCTSSSANCIQAVFPPDAMCCPQDRWLPSSSACCASGALATEYPLGSGDYICCPATAVVGGQCCDSSLTTNVLLPDGSGCCAKDSVVTNATGTLHCCTYCNARDQLCASASIAPASDPSCTWMEAEFCCCGAVLQSGNSTVCCPACASGAALASPAPYLDLRRAAECGAGEPHCCPQSQALPAPWLGDAYTVCCPADGDVSWFNSYSGAPYSAGNWSVTYGQQNAPNVPRCCPQSNVKWYQDASYYAYQPVCCKAHTATYTSDAYPRCPAQEIVLAYGYVGGPLGCCGGTKVARGCDGSATSGMLNCTYLREGDCCPRSAVVSVTESFSTRQRCCFNPAQPSARYVSALSCPHCLGGRGTAAVACCPLANVTQQAASNSLALACCPGAASAYVTALQSFGVLDYCCPVAQAVEGNAATGTEGTLVCCASALGGEKHAVISNGSRSGLRCCPQLQVPYLPTTEALTEPRYASGVCCDALPDRDASRWFLVGGACCLDRRTRYNSTTQLWECCAEDCAVCDGRRPPGGRWVRPVVTVLGLALGAALLVTGLCAVIRRQSPWRLVRQDDGL